MKENDLRRALDQVRLCDAGRARILETSRERLRRKETFPMKKKTLLALLAAVLVLTVGAVAAGTSGVWYSSSSSRPEYTQPPTPRQMERDAGFSAPAPAAFGNGYVFANGSVIKNVLEENGGQETFRSLCLRYEKDGSEVSLYLEPAGDEEAPGVPVAQYRGTALYLHDFINKLVPEDYILSPEERAQEQAGAVYFNFNGQEQTEETHVLSLYWQAGPLRCCLMQTDGPLTPEELEQMACELLDAG